MIDLFKTNGTSPPRNYRITEVRFTVVREAGAPPRPELSNPAAVARLARAVIHDAGREHFWIFLCDAKNQLIAAHHVSTGTLNASLVHPREVFGPALRVLGVASIAMAHNHPSGVPEPSREDIALTRKLAESARLLDFRILDHVIIGNGTDAFASCAERGII